MFRFRIAFAMLLLALLHVTCTTAALVVAPSSAVSMIQNRRNVGPASTTAVHKESELLTFHPDNSLEEMWSSFKSKYGKTYPSLQLELSRKLMFVENLEKIWKHNDQYARGLKSFTLGVNQFTDMSNQEFVSKMNGLKRGVNSTTMTGGATYMSPIVKFTVTDSVDWRTQGYVTPVKDQGQCGSCWTFSTTGTLEGQHFRQTGELVSLSEQNIVDCASQDGCGGGWEKDAYNYIIQNGGIDTEDSYPYDAEDEDCNFQSQSVGATMTGFVQVKPSGSEAKLKEAVATVGPISVNIDASHSSFQSYSGGIYKEPKCSTKSLDHAVLVVGYGTNNNQDYWIVKNSWATTWGDEGYIYMSRNNNNQCGIATDASYPLV